MLDTYYMICIDRYYCFERCLSTTHPKLVTMQDGYPEFFILMMWGAISVQVTCLTVIWACASRLRTSCVFAWCVSMLGSSVAVDVADMHSDNQDESHTPSDNDVELESTGSMQETLTSEYSGEHSPHSPGSNDVEPNAHGSARETGDSTDQNDSEYNDASEHDMAPSTLMMISGPILPCFNFNSTQLVSYNSASNMAAPHQQQTPHLSGLLWFIVALVAPFYVLLIMLMVVAVVMCVLTVVMCVVAVVICMPFWYGPFW